MNKKFSTLMATALLLSGSLFNEAYAEKLSSYLGKKVTKIENGKTYFLIEDVNDVTNGDVAVGFAGYSEQNKKITVAPLYTEYETGAEIDVDAYTWVVTETTSGLTGETSVTFKNVKTGQYLNVLNDGSAIVDDLNTPTTSFSNIWVWPSFQTYDKVTGTKYLIAGKKAKDSTPESWCLYFTPATQKYAMVKYPNTALKGFSLYEAADQEVSDTELNELYNSAGFNLKIKEGVDNIFADQRIKALDVTGFKADGTALGTNDSFGFPAGTYFVTETPAGSYEQATNKYDYLLNCTFIALSASDNASTSATKQKAGEGFTLTTVKGKDLNLFISTDKDVIASTSADQQTSGSTISVLNAAFTVKTNVVNNKDKYALSLDRVRIQEAAGNAKHVYKEDIIIDIKSDASYNSDEVLVSYPSTTQSFIFEFVASNVVEGKKFLNENGAAIYNIQFVGGDADGLYLTSAYNGAVTNVIKNYAKGIAIADLEAPAFQYVVTKVDGNNVTFTNRETGEDFTAQLFKEDGDDTYSLALTTDPHFYLTSINNKGDIEVEATASDLHLAWVKLTPVTVDKFAGFLNVEDETKMTLTFARDLDPTSNKLYPVVKTNVLQNKMTDNVEEAAQWQLIKSEKPFYKTYTFAYIDADDKVAYKSKGDTVAYYTYKFQYVYDGLAKDYFLSDGLTLANVVVNNADSYVVKENANGSVDILKDYNKEAYLVVSGYVDAKPNNLNRTLAFVNVHQNILATEIKAYLVQDAPEISLSADASYVTLKSELGNYVAMTGERDGIIVNNDPVTFRVFATDLKSVVPSFYVTTGWNAEDGSRMFLFNPADSVNYYVGAGTYDKEYQWAENTTKAIFKSGVLNASLDTLSTSILGKTTNVAMKADNSGVKGGLDFFKYQIILADAAEADDLYVVRTLANTGKRYLYSINDKLCWTENRSQALKFYIDNVEAPTANETIAAGNVVVAGTNGAVVVKGAEGKSVIVSTILGKVVANEVLTSDNAQITAPAGVVVVSVDGESFKVVVK